MENRKQIVMTFEGTQYTLEYTPETIKQMERNGFLIDDVMNRPMSTIPLLVAGAFLANHRGVKRETVDRVIQNVTNRQKFISTLVDMYSEPIVELMDEPAESASPVSWDANW